MNPSNKGLTPGAGKGSTLQCDTLLLYNLQWRPLANLSKQQQLQN